MGNIGYGYGSECHLLRWMGRHRNAFNAAVISALGVTDENHCINWLDFKFNCNKEAWYDSELIRLEFIKDNDVRDEWLWPDTGKQQNWDAIGYIETNNQPHRATNKDVILVEAKAHLGESESSCKAGENSSKVISGIFESTASELRIAKYDTFKDSWFNKYYQYANRLATYSYLKSKGYHPHLLLVYFINDEHQGKICPSDHSQWGDYLHNQDLEMGTENIYKNEKIFKLVLDIADARRCWVSAPLESGNSFHECTVS
ncbi:MAG: hypothetical protein PHY48_01665 [Candidatus Cloacimonetes bacterium]|nr:hypothetical protein [Candidatus Cloacimonadota bacterium]